MSWYNSTDNTFIDSTQSFEAGVVNSETTNINIDEIGTNTGENTTLNDIIQLRLEDDKYNVYINNNNVSGLIKFATEGDDVKVKIEEGKLFIYYDYNPIISLIIPSGWTNIIDNVMSNRQGVNNNSAGLLALGAQVQGIDLIVNEIVTIAIPSISITLEGHEGRIVALEASAEIVPDINDLTENEGVTELLDESIEALNETIQQGQIDVSSLSHLFSTLNNKRNLLLGLLAVIGFGGSVSAVLQLIEYFKDIYLEKQEQDNLVFLLKTLEATQSDANKDVKNKIYINGLTINQATNGGLTDGKYNVNLINGGILEIIVKNGNASISKVTTTSENYSVNDLIYINKTLIGGTTDTLEILVNELYSTTEIIGFEIVNVGNNIKQSQNRNRRRQNIPNKEDFTDGLDIIESTTTEESGEILPKIEIKLKLDENQFEYDADGNLQVKNYSIISDNTSDITTIQNTIGTPQDTKETSTIYGNIAKNVYDITLLDQNVMFKNLITDWSDSMFSIQENIVDGVTKYKLISQPTLNAISALGARNPNDNETAFEKITANKSDISGLRTDLTTQTERIDDMRLILGYDDNSILYLLLPKNDIGETPSIEANLSQNKGLLDIGYKTNDLAYNYDDYFDVLFIIPKFNKSIFNTTNEFQENMINNNYILTTNNFSIITDYNNFTSEISGTISFTLPSTDYLGVSFYANLYNQQVLRAILGYKDLSVDMKQDLIVITYTANQVNFRTILDSSFSTGLQIASTNDLLLGQNYSVHKLTSDDTLINGIYIINDSTENISYSSPYDIFTTSLGLSGGYDIYNTTPIQASNDAFLLYFNDDVIVKDLNIDLTRLWTYSGLAQQPYEPYVRINIFIGNTAQEAINQTTQILSNNFKSLGSTQYQSITSFNMTDANQNISCRYLYFTTEHQPHIRDTYSLKVSFLSINSQYSYNTITYLTQEANINIPNKECHFVINRDDVAKRLDLYVDGVLTSLYYHLIFFTDDYFFTMGNDLGLYTFRMLGVNTTNINPANFDNIKLLNDTTRSVNIDRLTTIEDLYVKDNLVCKNLEVINDSGNVLSFREETTAGRRRGLISDTTYTLLDEVILSTPPIEDAILYYNTTTGSIDTRSDVVLNSDLTAYQLKADAFDGDYNTLINKPTLFSGNYDDLSNKPNLSTYALNSYVDTEILQTSNYVVSTSNNISSRITNLSYNDLNNLPLLFSGNYDELINKPDLSSYALNTYLDTEILQTSNYVVSTSNNISTRITNLSYTELNDLPAIWNYALNSYVDTEILQTSNYVVSTSNNISSRITNLSYSVGDIIGLQDALDAKTGLGHQHTIANVFGLQSALDGKALSSHTHAISEIVDLQARLNEKALVTDLSGKADALHTHFAEDIVDLQSKLNLYKLNSDFNQDVSSIIRADLPTYAGDYLSYIQSTNKLQVDITLLLQNSDYTLIPNLQTAINNAGSGGGTSVWTLNDTKIYYNSGNVGIGNLNPYYKTHIKADVTDNTLKGSSLAVEGNSASYLWALTRNTTGTATLGLMTDYQAFDETTETGNATGLTITYFNQPTFKGASFQIANNEFIQMNQETNRIDINGKDLYLDGYIVEPYQITREQILLYIGNGQNNINYTTKGGNLSISNATDTGAANFIIDENNDLNLTLQKIDTGFSIKKMNGQALQNIFYIDENVCYINDTILSRAATEPPLNFNVGIFADTIRGTINRRADITTDIAGTETYYADGYPIFENAIQVKEIIFTDDPTFRFKSKTELRDAIITLDPNLSLMYDVNGNLKVTDSVAYTDTKVINILQSAFGDYLDFNVENVLGSVNVLQVSQAIDYNNIPNLADAIANAGGGGSSVPTGTTNNILFYDANLGQFTNDNIFKNITMDFKKKYYDAGGNEINSFDLLTIGEDPENPNTGLIDMGFGSIKAYKMNIDDRLDFVKTIVQNGQTYFLAGGYIENVFTPEGVFTNMYGQSAVFDNALIKKLTVNDFDVKGTIGQLDSAIPTKLAQPAQTTLRRSYGTSLDTEEAVYSTYYNKYTNDIEVYGIIFQDNTYIGSAQDIKNAISITDYALQSSLNTTNTNVATNTTDITALDTRLTAEENKDHFVNGDEVLTLGTALSTQVPTINLVGGNYKSVSSKIVFADNTNAGELYNGMAIYYDSAFNTLNISADENVDNIIDTPPAITIMRQNRYVGLHNTSPQYMLDVGGDVNTSGKYYSNGISLNNLVNDNSNDIISHNSRITTLENFNGVEKNNEKISLGNYTTSYTPELILAGGNGTTLSSRISFLDGVAPNTFAMSIVYDSYNNILNIAGDNDGNNIADTPNKLSVRRNGNVGISNNTPSYKLDVNGDINTTGNFKVNGSNFDAEYIKGLLETAGYRVLKNVMLNMTFTYQYITNTLINTWFKINPMGTADTIRINNGSFTLDYTNYRINIPQTGTYRINYNMNFTDVSSDRINMTIALYQNGVYLPASESRGSYGRFNGWQFGNSCGFIANLSAGDYLEFYGYMNRYGASYYFQVNGGASQLSIELIS